MVSDLKSLIYKSDYVNIGGGVIKSNYLDLSKETDLLYSLDENFIPIQSEEDFKKFKERLEYEMQQAKEKEKVSKESLEANLLKVINDNISEGATEEEKSLIFKTVINSPLSKSELEKVYWIVFDIIKNAEKTRNIFNFMPGIKLNKNDFVQKNRKKEEVL